MPDHTTELNKPSALTPRDIVDVLFRHRRLILTVMPAAFLLTLAFVFLTARKYQSEMKILVQNTRSNVILTADKTNASTTVADVTEQQINSQIEILRSRDVLDPVAEAGWDSRKAAFATPEAVKKHDKLVTALEKGLAADPVRKSNVITVSFVGKSPREAQATLQKVSAAFLTEQQQLLRPTGASDFFNAEAERYRHEWDEASKAFVAFQQQNQFVSLTDQEEALAKQVSGAQDALRALDVNMAELEGRIRGSKQSLADAQERQVTSIKTVPNQQSVQELSTLLVTLRNKRTTLLTQFKPTDRLVAEIEQQIAQTQSALTAAQNGSSQERTTDVNPTWQQIRAANYTNSINREAMSSQRAGLQRELAGLQTKLANTEALTVQYNLLKTRADNLRENYQLYVQKMEQATIEDAMDERKLSNVSIAQQPTLSYLPVSPKPLTDIALGLISASFITFALLYFAELGRVTIVTPRELELHTGKPVLVTVPFIRGGIPNSGASENYLYISHGDSLRSVLDRHVDPKGARV